MHQLQLILCLGMCLLLMGCSSPPGEASVTMDDLVAMLQPHVDGELRVQEEEILPGTFTFDSQTDYHLWLEEEGIGVDEFAGADRARTVTGYVSADGQQLSNAPKWAQALGVAGPSDGAMSVSGNPILYFRYRNFILSYSGNDADVVDMIRAVAGEPFAGN